ncbi:MAG: germination protein YpeB [Clostridia bacterium]|nr:germination protein YpeB [Clostridia bacterium]
MARLPIDSQELSNTAKFLNQVSDYSYSLSRKNINDEELTQEDLNNLKDLHTYSVDLKNTLNQLSNEINEGSISWGELTKKGKTAFAQEVSNLSKDSFSNVESNFNEYAGLIYDGAFSEHLTNPERKGLTGENIDEEGAKKVAQDIIGTDIAEELNSEGYVENGNIPSYMFSSKVKNSDDVITISISQKGRTPSLYEL